MNIDKNTIEYLADKIINDYYESPTPLFTHFIATFHARNDYSLLNFLLEFHYEVILKLDEELYLENYVETYYNDEVFKSYITHFYKKGKALLAEIVTTSKRLADENYREKYASFYEAFNKITTFDELTVYASTIKKPVKPNKFDENYPENIEDETTLKSLIEQLKTNANLPTEAELYKIGRASCRERV